MSELAIPAQARPMMVTFQELQDILLPLTIGYKWGQDTIHDLWKLGAPLPHAPNARIVLPRQLAAWLEDVLTKKGHPLDAGAKALIQLYSASR